MLNVLKTVLIIIIIQNLSSNINQVYITDKFLKKVAQNGKEPCLLG